MDKQQMRDLFESFLEHKDEFKDYLESGSVSHVCSTDRLTIKLRTELVYKVDQIIINYEVQAYFPIISSLNNNYILNV